MDMKRKGDVTISTVILIILGLAVLVMLIVGFTQGFDTLFGLFDRAPSELQTLAKACVVYAQGDLSIDFCKYNLIGNELVNCKDDRIKATLDEAGAKVISCSSDLKRQACLDTNLVPESKRDKIKLDGIACVQIIGSTGSN